MGRKSIKEIRRKEIVKVFYNVAISEGLENTSIAKIALELDCNPSLIIHYFETKDELIYGLIDYILERYSNIFVLDNSEISSKEEFAELIDQLFTRKWNELIDDGVFYSCYALTFKNDKIKRKFKVLHQQLRRKLIKILQDAKMMGYLDIERIEHKAELFFIVLEGAYYYLSLIDDKQEYSDLMNSFRMHAKSIISI